MPYFTTLLSIFTQHTFLKIVCNFINVARAAAAWAAMENLALSAKPLSTKKWIEKCPQSHLKLNQTVTSSKRFAAKNNLVTIRFRSLEIWWKLLSNFYVNIKDKWKKPSVTLKTDQNRDVIKEVSYIEQHSDLTVANFKKFPLKAKLLWTNNWTRK